MKVKFRLLWLYAALFLVATGARAESVVLDPIAGLSRASIYGPTDNGNGPPGLLDQSYSDETNGTLYNDFDGRTGSGFIVDQLLLYDLHRLSDATLSEALLKFEVNLALRNFSSDPTFFVEVDITLAGTNDATLGPADYALTPVLSTGFEFTVLQDGETYVKDINITGALTKLLDQGFDYATVFLSTPDTYNTTLGSSVIGFAQAPPLSVTGTGIHPNVPSVPEPTSVVHLGMSIVGLAFYALRDRTRPR